MSLKKQQRRRKSDNQIDVLCTHVQNMGTKLDELCTGHERTRQDITELRTKVEKLDSLDGLVETMNGLSALGKLADKGSAISKRVLQWTLPLAGLFTLWSVYWAKLQTWALSLWKQ